MVDWNCEIRNWASTAVRLSETVYYMRKGHINNFLLELHMGIRYINDCVPQLFDNIYACNPKLQDILLKDLLPVLKRVLDAQENGASLELADIIEMDLLPVIIEIRKNLPTYDEMTPFTRWFIHYDASMNYLRKRAENDHEFQKLFESIPIQFKNKVEYEMKESQVGFPILAIENENRHISIHSRINPLIEGKVLVDSYMKEFHEEYNVIGLGMGYHILALKEAAPGARINIYESDLRIIQYCLGTIGAESLFRGDVYLYYDPDYHKMRELLEKRENNAIILYSEIENIKDERIRHALGSYYIQLNAYREQEKRMMYNALYNIRNIHDNVEDIKQRIQHKNVYIVSAGPSLDKNYLLLKNKSENDIIITVGTCFKKLFAHGIIPDYVILLEAKDTVWNQVEWYKDAKIPFIIALSASREVAKNYTGKKYLALQSGWEREISESDRRESDRYESAGSVSTLAFDMMIKFNASKIIVVGLDLGYTNGKAHADDTSNQYGIHGENTREVTAYDGTGVVISDVRFDLYRKWYVNRILEAKRMGFEGMFVNATEGGSFIEEMINLPLEKTFILE